MFGNFSVSPDSFFGLETSCPDSDPYDNFTLTCTVTKPTIVTPNLVIAWTHNGTIEIGTVTTTENTTTTTVTNVLSFNSSTASDSGFYRCTASINSTTIMTSETRTVTIKCKWLCSYMYNYSCVRGYVDTCNINPLCIPTLCVFQHFVYAFPFALPDFILLFHCSLFFCLLLL